MNDYKYMHLIQYIKKYCNSNYNDFLKKSKDFEHKLIFHSYTDELNWIDEENKIIIYDEYSIGD